MTGSLGGMEGTSVGPDVNDPTDISRGVLVVCASMESAGSGWLFNMVNELLVAAGNADVRDIRLDYGLGDILRWHNCNVQVLDHPKWVRLQPPLRAGQTFVVKTHAAPTSLVHQLCRRHQVKTIYIYRDPRDVVVSAFQRGRNLRKDGNYRSFGRLVTIDVAIVWMRFKQLRIYHRWNDSPGTLMIRYEDLMNDAADVLRTVSRHLQVVVSDDVLAQTADRYRGSNSSRQTGTHFRGGGNRRHELTSAQLRRCNWMFRDVLAPMGYRDH